MYLSRGKDIQEKGHGWLLCQHKSVLCSSYWQVFIMVVCLSGLQSQLHRRLRQKDCKLKTGQPSQTKVNQGDLVGSCM